MASRHYMRCSCCYGFSAFYALRSPTPEHSHVTLCKPAAGMVRKDKRSWACVPVLGVLCLQAIALEMVQDINCGVSWVLSNILHYGGDPGQVFLAGQSCGGHLASLAVLTQVGPCAGSAVLGARFGALFPAAAAVALQANSTTIPSCLPSSLQAEQQGLGQHVPGGLPAWDVTRIRAFVGISGVYNVHDLVDHFDRWLQGRGEGFEGSAQPLKKCMQGRGSGSVEGCGAPLPEFA